MAVQNQVEGEEKINLGVVVTGQINCGKSTMCCRLLHELGLLPRRDLERLRREATELGKASFMWAFYFDKSRHERARGITIICCSRKFETNKYNYNLIDAPGHKDFIKNTIYGISKADVAILVISADGDKFEHSIIRDRRRIRLGATRHHSRLCWLMGIKQIIVCINKMDLIGYNKDRFLAIKTRTIALLSKLGFKKTKRIAFIPISGYFNDNLTRKSANMSWWNGFTVTIKKKQIHGYTLYDALDKVVTNPKRSHLIKDKDNKQMPFLMPIEGMYKIRGVGDVITGRIEQGHIDVLKNGNIRIYPRDVEGKIVSMKQMHQSEGTINTAKCGDYIGCNVKNMKMNYKHWQNNKPRKGDVMLCANNKPQKVLQFEALVYVENHCGKLKCRQEKTNFNCRGYTPIVYVRNSKSPCKLIKIFWKKRYGSNTEIAYFPKYISYGDLAQVIFEPRLEMFILPFAESNAFGRIAIMDHSYLIMIGKVIHIYHKKDELNGINSDILLNGYVRRGMKRIRGRNANWAIIPFEIINIIRVFYGSYEAVQSQQNAKTQRPMWDTWDYDPQW